MELTNAEIEFRAERAKKINIMTSHFPYIKTFKDFDFSYQPSVKREQIADLMTLRFIETKTNIVFVGTSGVGKTHLATAFFTLSTEITQGGTTINRKRLSIN